jgi:uncharacterized membrane protein YccC
LRAAIATVGPLLVGSAAGWPDAVWMGLAGFNVALSDKGGTLQTRLGAMLPAAAYGTLAGVAGALAGRNVWSAAVVFALWAIGAGIARSYGAAAIGTGVLSLATLVVSMEQPARTAEGALERGGAILGGAAFAIALSLLLGRFLLYRPARLAVARVYRLLARVAEGDETALQEMNDAVAAARRTLTQLRRGMQRESRRGERLLVLLESGDRMADLLAGSVPPHPQLAALLLAIADGVEHERFDPTLGVPGSVALRDPLSAALTALRELQEEGDGEAAPLSFRREYVDPLRAALTWTSAVFRHALRVAVAGGLAVTMTRALHIDRGYWLTLTVVVVLQPYTSATLQRGLQRVAGTVAGAIVAALLLSVVRTPQELMLIVFVGAALTVAVLPVNYGLFSFALTPTFVLLAEVHAIDRHLVWLRVNNTLLGALLALLAAWLLWPASERGRVRDDLTAALRALAELTRCTAECDDALIADARRAASVALENGEASLQRVLSEARQSTAAEEAMMAVLIYARRYATMLASLADDRQQLATTARPAAMLLHELANAVAQERPAIADDLHPVVEPLAGLRAAVGRLAGG